MYIEEAYFSKTVKKVRELIHSIISLEDLYSTIVNPDGKVVLDPVGPDVHMGRFYDLFERPEYKDLYEKIKKTLTEKPEPFCWEMENGNPNNRISAAPIMIDGNYAATWLLCSYSEEQAKNLSELYKNQWIIAKLISEYLTSVYSLHKRETEIKETEKALVYEVQQREIITGMLARIASPDMDATLESVFEKTGKLLELDSIIFYLLRENESDENGPEEFALRKYWSATGELPDASIDTTWHRNSYLVQENEAVKRGGYIVDSNDNIGKVHVGSLQGRMRALMAYPIVVNDIFVGWLAFLENKSERVWKESEILFTRELSRLVKRLLDYKIGEGNTRKVNEFLLDTYNYLPVGIFIRDTSSGKVLFSNQTLNDMLGYDFTGTDSGVLLTDMSDKFDNMAGMRTHKITNNNIMKWRKYIDKFDAIVDISEIQIEWLNKKPASIVVMKPVED